MQLKDNYHQPAGAPNDVAQHAPFEIYVLDKCWLSNALRTSHIAQSYALSTCATNLHAAGLESLQLHGRDPIDYMIASQLTNEQREVLTGFRNR